MAEVEEPEVLLCPITHAMYRDPVFIPESGNSYEHEAIETWLKSGQQRDPLSNVALSGLWYTNWGIRRGVQSFLDAHPKYTPQGWEDRSVPPPQRLERPLKRWRRLGFWIFSCLLSLALVLEHLHIESAFWPQLEQDDTDVVHLKVPKGSRLEAWKVGGRLVIKLPAPGFQAAVVCPLIFSILWLTFVTYWCITAWNSGVRMSVAFSLPFWAVGLMLLFSTLLTPSLSQTLTASTLDYQLKSQVLHLSVSRLEAKVNDLEEVPGVFCSNGSDCRLVLQDGVQEVEFGADLKPVEVRWIQKQLCSHWGLNMSKCISSATYTTDE